MNGLGIVTFIISVVGFLIAMVITRTVFSIGKIVELLKVIAQELRARNLLEDVGDKLNKMGLSKDARQSLNSLHSWDYSKSPSEVVLNKPLK